MLVCAADDILWTKFRRVSPKCSYSRITQHSTDFGNKNRRQLRWSLFKTLIEIIKNKLTITRSLKIKNTLLCFCSFLCLFHLFLFVCLFFNANIFFIGGVGAQISHYIGTLYRLSHEQIKRWRNLTALNFLSGYKNREKHLLWHNLSFNFSKRILVLSAGVYRPDRHLRISC